MYSPCVCLSKSNNLNEFGGTPFKSVLSSSQKQISQSTYLIKGVFCSLNYDFRHNLILWIVKIILKLVIFHNDYQLLY